MCFLPVHESKIHFMGRGLGMVRSIEVGRYLHMAAHGSFLIGGSEGFYEMEAGSGLRDVGRCGGGID